MAATLACSHQIFFPYIEFVEPWRASSHNKLIKHPSGHWRSTPHTAGLRSLCSSISAAYRAVRAYISYPSRLTIQGRLSENDTAPLPPPLFPRDPAGWRERRKTAGAGCLRERERGSQEPGSVGDAVTGFRTSCAWKRRVRVSVEATPPLPSTMHAVQLHRQALGTSAFHISGDPTPLPPTWHPAARAIFGLWDSSRMGGGWRAVIRWRYVGRCRARPGSGKDFPAL